MHPICYLTCFCCVHNHFTRASFFRETGKGALFSGVSFMKGMHFMNGVGLRGGGLMKGVGLGGSWAHERGGVVSARLVMSFMREVGFMGYLYYK